MKNFILVRHAKSSWDFPNLKDIDRPLNARGKRDAPKMAMLLKGIVPKIDIIYASPGKRAHDTAIAFSEAYDIDKKDISIETNLYFGSETDIMDIIQASPEEADTIAMYSHNPTSTYFVNSFDGMVLDNLPTCGIAIFESSVDNWKEVNYENSKVIKILRPKFDL